MKNKYHFITVSRTISAFTLFILLAFSRTVYAAVFEVCPEATQSCSSIYTFNWPALTKDDVVVIHGGTYTGAIYIYNVLNGANIVSDGYNDVFINNVVAFINSRNVVWDGRKHIHIQNMDAVGMAIVQGSANLTITATEITHTGLGIWISQAAGCGHIIDSNTTAYNLTHGIAVDKINCTAGNETFISNNTVTGNLYHGIELNGNYYVVEGNEVAWNGHGISGTSGIHVYAADGKEGTGQHNVIRYNTSHDNSDINGPDGNGIQLDQWTRFNAVYGNSVYNNNGAGILVYDASDAELSNNRVYNNMLDTLGTHICCKANVVVTSASAFQSGVDNHVNNITVTNNTISGADPAVAPIFVDPFTATKNVTIANNTIE